MRLGFLGLLHLDVFRQRLRDEFAEDVLFTAPLVPYRVRWRDGRTTELATLDDWPSAEEQRALREKLAQREQPRVQRAARAQGKVFWLDTERTFSADRAAELFRANGRRDEVH